MIKLTNRALGAGFNVKMADDDPRITGLSPPFQTQLRAKAKQLILEDGNDEAK